MDDDIRRLVVILLALSVITGLAVPALAQTAETTSQNTILQNLAGSSGYSTLTNMAKTAGLDSTLAGAGPYTVFAPGNTAFGQIPQESVSALMNDKAKLGELMSYHVVPGKLSASDLANRDSLQTIDGKTLPVSRQPDGTITVGGATVTGSGIDSSNGIIYPVSGVMTPPGFVMPQAAQSPAQGLPWWILPLGLLALIAIGAYMMMKRRRHAEPAPREAYREKAPAERTAPRYEEERAHAETTGRTPEETMKEVRESTAAYKTPQIADIAKNLNLPLSGVALAGLNALISKGTFSDKQDFIGFLGKTFFANNMESAMAGGKEPSESMIMDVINKTGIAKGFSRDDTMKMLVPLLITGFTAVYNYLHKKPAAVTR
ncbi:fasciclin domain-containing protein [Methanocella arvoryzae]|uniref:FAS1 domain-containing protein n=1 Tax=Methanocella arvoryzae (strain DSM 22066 / NBRC 105507 / MRE50) TaxID=351160 RepID=Q0W5D3_METAR|nr:fasciclin domain-containing protein [Methanocella arvoryzae]CAJ36410.1 hypothetical protein RCIX1092 [Methanocella arvoryzae MRE50]